MLFKLSLSIESVCRLVGQTLRNIALAQKLVYVCGILFYSAPKKGAETNRHETSIRGYTDHTITDNTVKRCQFHLK